MASSPSCSPRMATRPTSDPPRERPAQSAFILPPLPSHNACAGRCRHYVHAGEEASFFTVIKRARQRQEVAVGYCDSEGQIHLNPGDKASGRRWSAADKIVVLADE